MNRRRVLATIGVLGAGSVHAGRAPKPHRMKPQVDDVLVHAFGERAGVPIVAGEVDAKPLNAFPKAPDGVVRDGSLHNQLLLLRVDEGAMTAKTQRYASGPFVAYSASCTHTGCEVSGWLPEERNLVCPCHGSRFDIADAARVALGPAPKPLAMLPIERAGELFRVTGSFSRRVGPEPL